MPQVTKKIYPAVEDTTQVKTYIIQPNGTIAVNGYDYADLCLSFDTTDIKQADSMNLCICLTKATTYMYNNFDFSKLKTYLKIESNAYSYEYNPYNAGTVTKSLEGSAIEYICNNNKLNIHVEPWVINYSGSKPTITQDLCNLTTTIDAENSYIEVLSILPEISNFSIDGNSIDSNITCTWTQEDVTSWVVQAIQDNTVISSITGTSESTCTFEVGVFSKSGTTIFKIIAETDGTTVESSQVVELTQTVPQIISIEPNGILKLLTNPIDIEFTGTNITSFVMNVYQNNINKFTFSGTTERKATVIANVFSSGTVTIEIVAKYICAYYETSTTRSVTFTAYGPPPNPILNIESTYNTPFPLIKWSSSEQLSYQIKIDTLDTGEIYSNDKMYQVTEALTNHTYYAVSLRIKNQYNLWSEWVTSTIYIDFAELSQPEFNIYADTDQACIVINIKSPEDVNFCYHEVYRRESNVWVKIATDIEIIGEYKDFACASNITYDYKVRAITTVGGYTDSVIKEMQCNFKGNILSVPFTDVTFNVIHSKEETGIQKSTSLLVDRKFVVYCGCEKPKETRGLTKYRQFSLSTTFKTLEDYLEFEKLTSERVVLFRDNKGTKAYCSLAITGMTDEKTFYATVDLSLTEVYYKEGDYSEAESRPLRFIDEEW